MSVNSKMTNIANKIRSLLGITGKLGLDAMDTNLETANTEVVTQEGLMEEILIALAGKSVGGSGLPFDTGEFVLDTDLIHKATIDGIPHKLGEAPEVVIIWTDEFKHLSADNLNPYDETINMGYIFIKGLFGMSQRLSSVTVGEYGIFLRALLYNGDYRITVDTPSSAAYCMSESYLPTSEKIGLVSQGNSKQLWKAGVTYKYFVSKSWWNIGG